MNTKQNYDAVIIGAGHNGLVCAYYLARKGYKTIVLERCNVVGGAAITEEFHPGFRNSVASYTVSLLQPKVIADMQLERHGLEVVLRKIDNFLPSDTGYLLAGGNGLTLREITATPDEYSSAVRKAKEQYLAVAFLQGAEERLYGGASAAQIAASTGLGLPSIDA